MKRNIHILFTVVIIMVAVNLSFGQTTYFVDISQPDDSGDGTSWATAKRNLQTAIDLASAGDEVRVAHGMYIPNEFPNSVNISNPRHRTFHINRDIILKGSFDPATNTQDLNNPSILSGDFNADDVIAGSGKTLSITNRSENAFHVIITADLTEAAVIDGFTIQGGNATGTAGPITFSGESILRNRGGGMFNSEGSAPSISNMTFFGNTAEEGGGLFNTGDFMPTTRFTITTSTFIQNLATDVGGGMRNTFQLNIHLDNLTFTGNKADWGGGLATNVGIVSLTNSTFDANEGSEGGGGIYDLGVAQESIIKNCVFRDNKTNGVGPFPVGNGGAISTINGNPAAIIGCRFFRNRAIDDGGAISIIPDGGGDMDFINNIFVDNHSLIHGGAMYLAEPGSTNIVNNVFVRNTSSNSGAASALFLSNEVNPVATTITNCTFFGNRRMSVNTTSTVANTIIASTSFGSDDRVTFDNTVFFNNSGVEINIPFTTVRRNNFAQNFQGTGFTTLTSNPFIDSANPEGADNIFGTLDDGLFPAENSPLIDAGSNTNLPLDTRDIDNDNDTTERIPIDIAGMQRITSDNVDVGAYEFDTTLSVDDNAFNNELLIYPNPVQNILQISNLNNTVIDTIEVFDIQGRLVKQFNSFETNSTLNLDISELKAAIYLVRINSGNTSNVVRIIKE